MKKMLLFLPVLLCAAAALTVPAAAAGGIGGMDGETLAIVVLIFSNWVKPTKKWHPIVFIAISAVVGVVFGFAGV